jgi:hypothetical protein
MNHPHHQNLKKVCLAKIETVNFKISQIFNHKKQLKIKNEMSVRAANEDLHIRFDKCLAEIRILHNSGGGETEIEINPRQKNNEIVTVEEGVIIKTSRDENDNFLPDIDEEKLLETAGNHGLANDQSTRMFIKFLSVTTNFASHKFADRVQHLPTLITTIRDLVQAARAELRAYADCALLFDEVVSSYVRLVLHTVQNLEMTLPYLQNAVTYMHVVRETLLDNEEKVMSDQDLDDIEHAFRNMSAGVDKLKEYARESKQERESVEKRIDCLKENMEGKVEVIGNRLSFSKFLPKIAASTGNFLYFTKIGLKILKKNFLCYIFLCYLNSEKHIKGKKQFILRNAQYSLKMFSFNLYFDLLRVGPNIGTKFFSIFFYVGDVAQWV